MLSFPKILVGVLLLIAHCRALPIDDVTRLVQPPNTGLKLEQRKSTEGDDARFTGQTWVEGRFVARWPDGVASSASQTLEYLVIPDPKGAARLPHFTLTYKHRRRTYSIKTIDLANGEIALRLVVGEMQARRLLERQVDSVDVVGSFLLTDYDVGVECDAAWARATLVKARTRDLVTTNAPLPEGC